MILFLKCYCIFAVTTGAASYWTLYKPTLEAVCDRGYDIYLRFPFIVHALWAVFINTLLAPIVFRQVLTGPTEEIINTFIKSGEEDE